MSEKNNIKEKLFSLSFSQILQIVLPLALIAVYTCCSFTYMVNVIIQKNTVRVANELNRQVEYEVRLQFEPPVFAVNTLGFALAKSQEYDYILNLLQATAFQYPQCEVFYYGSIKKVDDGGLFILSNDDQVPEGYDHTQRDWFVNALEEGGGVYISEPYVSASSSTVCLTFSRLVFDEDGEEVGVVATDLVLSNLSDVISALELSPNTVVNIVDRQGLYLTNKDATKLMKVKYFDDSEIDKKKYDYLNYLDGIEKSFVQGNRFYAVRKIGVTQWFAVIEGPISDFTGTARMWFFIVETVTVILILSNVVYNGHKMNKTKLKENSVSAKLLSETQNLAVASKENAATAQDQSAAVKEIVATMEDQNSLSENIAQKIKDVAGVANNTNQNVNDGKQYLEANVAQLNEIAGANQNTIDGIKALGDKIGNIWDIVTLINSVADQAKIIAFNAELEASSAGEAGKNFHIVATEIRRLADGIIDGTKEIKASINEIQQSSDSLILASENGTDKIKVGVENAKNLEERFTNIKNASEITATSANEITTIIQQQAMATEQILITLKQISAGVENFTAATENISKASSNLKNIASELTEQKQRAESKMEEA